MLDTTRHGYKILQRKTSASIPDSEFVIAHRDDTSFHPFVVWRMEIESGICEGGGYYSDMGGALHDFSLRY